ncbi:pilin [Bordetella hinzii]|uniref:pilin n=1 Tax=Bordetella hinzii TaxID=103855 RepID=UPI0009B80BCC|nr:pilin [Bordetella hinzii]
MNYDTKKKNGFTIIELMIAVAITGVLGAVAVPAYQDYTIRAQISEGIVLAEGAKPMITEYHATHGEYPTNSAAVGYSGATGNYVAAVEVHSDGNIVATMGNQASSKIQGKRVVLTPSLNGGSEITLSSASTIVERILGIGSAFAADPSGWSCYSDVEPKYLPKACEHRNITGGETQPGEEPVEGPSQNEINAEKSYKGKMIYMLTINNIMPNVRLTIDSNGMGSSIAVVTTLPGTIDSNTYAPDFIHDDGSIVMEKKQTSAFDFLSISPDGSVVYKEKGRPGIKSFKNGTTTNVTDVPAWITDYLAANP